MSYRNSHIETDADEYHSSFSSNWYRADLWNFEKNVLKDVVQKHRTDTMKENSIRLLDFACGSCRVLQYLEEFCDAAIGCDVSEAMLIEGRKHLIKAKTYNLDLTKESLPKEVASVNCITAFRFFTGAESRLQSQVITRLAGLLGPGGVLIFNNHRNYYGSFYVIQRLYYGLIGRDWNTRCMKSSSALKLISESGLCLESIHHWGVLPNGEAKTLIPRFFSSPLEKVLSRIGIFRKLASSQIYVCRKV